MFSRHYTHGNLSVEGQVTSFSIDSLMHTTTPTRLMEADAWRKGYQSLDRRRESEISHALRESQSGAHGPTPPLALAQRLQQRATFLFAFLAIFTETAVFLELGLSVFSGTPVSFSNKMRKGEAVHN